MMSGDMKIISIRQPWAWLIVAGHKDIENRSWGTSFRGEVLIHAAKRIPYEDECTDIEQRYGVTLPEDFDVGGIIGAVTIDDCVSHQSSKWFHGPFGFVLSNPRPLEFVPYRGQLGFFDATVRQIGPLSAPVTMAGT
jgi:hypothetical protein